MNQMQNVNKYLIANTIDETIELLEKYPSAKIIAGGTDLLPNYKQKNVHIPQFIDISNIDDLKKISISKNNIVIGACTKLEDLLSNTFIQEHFPVISNAVKEIATPVIRKTATIAGNLLCDNRCIFYNQSEWWRMSIGKCLKCGGDICIATGGKKKCFSKNSSDLAPALLVCDATISIINNKTIKTISLNDLYTGDGLNPILLKNDAIIIAINIPVKKRKYYFYKLRQRNSIDFSSVNLAISFEYNTKLLKISIGSMDPKPILWTFKIDENNFEEFINSKIKKIGVVDNDFYPREYRKSYLMQKLYEAYNHITAEKH